MPLPVPAPAPSQPTPASVQPTPAQPSLLSEAPMSDAITLSLVVLKDAVSGSRNRQGAHGM